MSEKVTLATFIGGADQLEVDGEVLVRGVQYQVSKKLAHRLKDVANVVIVTTKAGSELDERAPDPVVETPPTFAAGDELPETPVPTEQPNETPETPAESEK